MVSIYTMGSTGLLSTLLQASALKRIWDTNLLGRCLRPGYDLRLGQDHSGELVEITSFEMFLANKRFNPALIIWHYTGVALAAAVGGVMDLVSTE